MNDKVRHPEHRLRPMERAVTPSIEDGMGEVVGMKRTVLWFGEIATMIFSAIPDLLVGRVVGMVRVVPFLVVDAVVYLRYSP